MADASNYIPGIGFKTAGSAVVKKPAPVTKNPGLGRQTAAQIRVLEKRRNPKQEPIQANIPAKGTPVDPKVDAYIRNYIKQMRAAGYPDYVIKSKLISGGDTITIPDNYTIQNVEPWTGGMAGEFNANPEGGALRPVLKNIPAAGELSNFAPGGTANRLPTYGEASGRNVTTPYMNTSGKFSQNEQGNLRNALANYMANYKGETVPMSQWASTAGVAGLPNDLANQWMPEKTALDEFDARNLALGDKAQTLYQEMSTKWPEAGIVPTDTFETMVLKGAAYEKFKAENEIENKNITQSNASYQDLIKVGNSIIDDYNKGNISFTDTNIIAKADGTGQDVMAYLQETIMNGAPIEAVMQFVLANNIPLSTYQITGLMAAYGKY